MSEKFLPTRYRPEDREAWNGLVAAARNGTFLFHRDYMEYHADRFEDYSLVVRNAEGRTVALLPANRRGSALVSHGGLTYGGLVYGEGLRTAEVLEIFAALAGFLRERGFEHLLYKTVPTIYHAVPAEEDRYCLFRWGAQLYRRDVLAVVDYRQRIPYQQRRARTIRKAAKEGVSVRETRDFQTYWTILQETLQSRYGVDPVHSATEIERLAGRFPESIRLYAAYRGEEMLGGVVAYLSREVCHLQYIAAGEEGKRVGALDLVMDTLLREHAAERRYFDFGISNEENGRVLNEGLMEYKEGFGARAVAHDFYAVDLTKDPT